MQLLIVRHGLAAEQAEWAPRPDADRPLTDEGQRRMRAAALGLRQVLPEVSAVLTSPLKRARQTADVLGAVYGVTPRVVPELSGGQPPGEVLALLRSLPALDVVVLVGHEPDLSTLIGLLLSGEAQSFVKLGKGAACLLELDQLEPAGATQRWLLTPSLLRALAAGSGQLPAGG